MLKVGVLLSLVIVLVILMNSSDCDSQKPDDRILSLEADVKQLKMDVAEIKQKQVKPEHHYELRSEGFRTFRFDPATGETCIQLTSTDDWKHKETKAHSCSCADEIQKYIARPTNTDADKQFAQSYYDAFVKPACGE